MANRNYDPFCNYQIFESKPGGKVPCLALGGDDVRQVVNNPLIDAPITGIAFQKVDTGIVRPVMGQNEFSPVDWPNEPTRENLQRIYIQVPNQPPANHRPIWEEFISFSNEVGDSLQHKLTPPGGNVPPTIYDGMRGNYWQRGTHDEYKRTINYDRFRSVRQYLMNRRTWVANETLHEWAHILIGGLYGNLMSFGEVMKTLFPLATHLDQRFITPPSETLKNATISDGVPFCLMYGYDREQARSNKDCESDGDGDCERQGRLKKRVLLKRLGREARSRSRSPVKQVDEHPLHLHVTPVAQSLNEVLDDPDGYQLFHPYHHEYFEPHKPDLCLINWLPKKSGSSDAIAKIIFEISSYRKYPGASFEKTIEYNTEQLVQACLAALAIDQTAIHGLSVMVDGLKWIKVEKQNQGGGYRVGETDFIFWNQRNEMLSLFRMIEDVM